MKHIKLFEDFNGDIYIEDAKYIIIFHLGEGKDIPIDTKHNINDLLRFDLEEIPTKEQIKRCEEHLKEEGFFLNIDDKVCIVGIFGIVNSVEEYCLNWLNTNFGNLKPIIKGDTTYYVEDNKAFIYYYQGQENGDCYIDYGSIWSFFEVDLYLGYKKIEEIIERWLELTYNLMVVKPSEFYEEIELT